MSMVVGNVLLSLFFLYATFVQLNDPDSDIWIALYGSAAGSCIFSVLYHTGVLCCLSSSKRFLKIWIQTNIMGACLLIGYTVGAARSINLSPRTEIGREMDGCLIVLFWMLINRFAPSKSDQHFISRWTIFVISLTVLASAWIIPTFFLAPEDAQDHCTGLGINVGEL